MRHCVGYALSGLLLASSTAFAGSSAPPPSPLLDGRCSEYEALAAKPLAMDDDVALYVHQDAHYVWLCYTLPEGSFGTLDLRIESAGLPEPLNLHVSAQLGEWPADKPELAPQIPDSDQWWNVQGWTANWLGFNGMDAASATPRPRFKLTPAREIQLSRRRFGEGPWRLSFAVGRVRTRDGAFVDLKFPRDGSLYTLQPRP